MLLPVSAPFHCQMMAPAADAMAQALANVTIKEPRCSFDCQRIGVPHHIAR